MYSSVSLAEILRQRGFEGTRILAGAEGIDRPVSSVTVAEIPDISKWLSGHDFVHGVGRMFVDDEGRVDEEGLQRWVASLIGGGAACLALKTNRYITEIPQSVLDLGDRENFPIIELPDDTVQAHVSEVIYTMLLDAQHARETKRTKLFAEMVRDLSGPHVLAHDAQKMAEHLDKSIAIVTKDFKFVGVSLRDSAQQPNLASMLNLIKQTIAEGAVLPELAASPEQLLVESYVEDSTGLERHLVVVEVNYHGETLGYACLIGEPNGISQDDIYFFASLAEVLTVDMSQNILVETSALMSRSEFLAEISKPDMDERKALHLADLIGLNYVQPMRVAVMSIGDESANFASKYSFFGESERRAINYLTEMLGAVLPADEDFFVAGWERGLAVIFTGERRDKTQYTAIMERAVQSLQMRLKVENVLVGIGQSGMGIRGIHESAENAFYALNCIQTFELTDQVIRYDQLGSYLFLSASLCSSEAAGRYVDYVLGPLLKGESGYSDDLLGTLRTFLQVSGSYQAAAKELSMHVNTVRYRMSKIAALLPVDITTIDGRGAVWLAMRLHKFMNSGDTKFAPSCGPSGHVRR